LVGDSIDAACQPADYRPPGAGHRPGKDFGGGFPVRGRSSRAYERYPEARGKRAHHPQLLGESSDPVEIAGKRLPTKLGQIAPRYESASPT
jgi:hypothetical protein